MKNTAVWKKEDKGNESAAKEKWKTDSDPSESKVNRINARRTGSVKIDKQYRQHKRNRGKVWLIHPFFIADQLINYTFYQYLIMWLNQTLEPKSRRWYLYMFILK